ncbi:hypothetical protein HY024_02870 [Candidatus Curtissbacteria bacterium]|nr:hypothetical protein [Candidatus Curtissbacteria bacterium]
MASSFKLRAGAVTLVEFLTSFAIVGVIAVLVGGIYLAHFRLFSNQNTAIDVSTQNKLALSEVSNTVRQSESIVDTCPSCGSDTTGTTILILRLWPQDATGEPIDPGTTNYDYILYKRNPGDTSKLIRITYAYSGSSRKNGTKVIATSMSNLAFAYDNGTPSAARQVTTSVTTTATTGTKTQTSTESDIANLRNK